MFITGRIYISFQSDTRSCNSANRTVICYTEDFWILSMGLSVNLKSQKLDTTRKVINCRRVEANSTYSPFDKALYKRKWLSF